MSDLIMKGFIGENSIIRNVCGEETAKIYSNCRVFDSVLADGVTIGDFGTVRESYIGEKSTIQRYADIWGLKLGKYSCIGRVSTIQETKIGNFCALADYMTIGCDDHDYKMLSIHPFWHDVSWGISDDKEFSSEYRRYEFREPCEIGNDVWIGAGVNVCRNVKIGDGCVIGAGAVITKDIPPYSVVVGVPGKIIKKRFDEKTIEILEKCNWWNLPINVIREKLYLFKSGYLDNRMLCELEDVCKEHNTYKE